jgi:hypothetical protein
MGRIEHGSRSVAIRRRSRSCQPRRRSRSCWSGPPPQGQDYQGQSADPGTERDRRTDEGVRRWADLLEGPR